MISSYSLKMAPEMWNWSNFIELGKFSDLPAIHRLSADHMQSEGIVLPRHSTPVCRGKSWKKNYYYSRADKMLQNQESSRSASSYLWWKKKKNGAKLCNLCVTVYHITRYWEKKGTSCCFCYCFATALLFNCYCNYVFLLFVVISIISWGNLFRQQNYI